MYNKIFDKEKLERCIQCGKCSSGCEINRPHRLLRLISIGETDKLFESGEIWKCTTCFTCSERCPQGVGVTEILWKARGLAVKSGYIPEITARQKEALSKTGRLHPVSPRDNDKRKKAGLMPIPQESHVVAQIFKITGIEK